MKNKKLPPRSAVLSLALMLSVCWALVEGSTIIPAVHLDENLGVDSLAEDDLPFTFYNNGTRLVLPDEHFHHRVAARDASQLDINIYFQDVINGVTTGFNDPTTGAARRDCVTQSFAYVNSFLSVNPNNVNKRWNILVINGANLSPAGGYSSYDSAEFSKSYAERVIIDGELVGGDPNTVHSTLIINLSFNFDLATCTSPQSILNNPTPLTFQYDYVRAILRSIYGALGVRSNLKYQTNNCAGANPAQSTVTQTVVGTCSPFVNWATSFDKNFGDKSGPTYFSGAPGDDTYTGPQNGAISNSAAFLGTNAKAANGGAFVRMSSSAPFNTITSMSFLSNLCIESNYLPCVTRAGFVQGEARRSYTPVELAILKDLGYSLVSFNNDECPNATPVSLGTTTFSTTGMTGSLAAPTSCPTLTNDLWFSYKTLTDGWFIFETCGSTFDTAITIYDTCSFDGTAAHVCDTNGCGISRGSRTIFMYKGQVAYIRIGSTSGATGDGSLRIVSASTQCDANPYIDLPDVSPAGLPGTAGLLLMNRVTPCSSSFKVDTLSFTAPVDTTNGFQNGDPFSFYLWQDLDGDGNPFTGTMTLIYSETFSITGAVSGTQTFTISPSSSVTVSGGGDIYIGFIGRHSRGGRVAIYLKADPTTSHYRSYFGTGNNNVITVGDPLPQLQALRNLDSDPNRYRFMLSMTTTDLTSTPLPVVSVNSFPEFIPESNSPATFIITRSGATTGTLTVNFDISGTAVYGTHYTTNFSGGQTGSNSFTFATGESAKTILITPIPDSTVLIDRTVVLTVSSDAAYTTGSGSPSTVTIADVTPTFYIGNSALSQDEGAGPVTFTLYRDLTTSYDSVVTLTPSGTVSAADFSSDPFIITSINFPGSSTSVSFSVTPVADALAEPSEDLTFTIAPGSNYFVSPSGGSATLTVTDSTPTVSISVSPSPQVEGAGDVTFTLTRDLTTPSGLVVTLTPSGSATADDFLSDPSSITTATFSGSSTSVSFSVTPVTDALAESDETLTFTIASGSNYAVSSSSGSATLTVIDLVPQTAIEFDIASGKVNEGSGPVTFTVSRSFATDAEAIVNLDRTGSATVGDDFTLSGISSDPSTSITIPANQASATFTVTPLSDNQVEGDETVIFTINTGSSNKRAPTSSVTLTIADTTPEITLDISSSSKLEGSGPVTFTLTRTKDTTSSLDVLIDLSGTASFGTDYTTTLTQFGSNTVTIPSGFASTTFTVTPSSDSFTSESSETVIATISPSSSYAVGSPSTQTLSITNDASGAGDPHMVGFHGQRFDFIGRPGKAYNILSDSVLQVNTELGMQKTSDHTYIGGPVMMKMAFLTANHTVLVNAGGYFVDEIGFVSVDGMFLTKGTSVFLKDDKLSVSFSNFSSSAKDLGLIGDDDKIVAKAKIILEGMYEFTVFFIQNHHSPYRPDIESTSPYYRRFLDFNASLLDRDRRPHGVLGQTAAPLGKGRSVGDWTIEGKDEDYVVQDGLTGTQFSFNKF